MIESILCHLVLFSTRPEASEDDVDAALDGIRRLVTTGEVRSISVGRDVSRRGAFDVGLCAEFASLEQLERYLVHPDHVRLVEETLPRVFQSPWQVVDYWTSADHCGS